MALDGAFLHHIRYELEEKLKDGRVDKIYQPSKDELVLQIRTRQDTFKLLISARPDTARIHITKINLENPKQPPMLCMLLRKKLQSGRLIEITQDKLERALYFHFDCTNELGDKVKLTLACEIMGKHSNVILIDENNRIIDAVKRVSADVSTERLVFPGIGYEPPPPQEKLCIFDVSAKDVINTIKNLNKAMHLNKALMTVLQGISPIVAREIEHVVGRGSDVVELNEYQENRLFNSLISLKETVSNCSGEPYTVVTDKPLDFSFLEINQYGDYAKLKKFDSFSSLLENYYSERDRIERMKVKSADILRLLANRNERIARKINNQKIELENSDKKEEKRIFADLINGNLHAVPKGEDKVTLINYYDENMAEVEIKLDPALTPAQNAQKYYKDYRKAKTAQVILAEQIEIANDELVYIDSLFYSLTEAETEQDLNEIRAELAESGYIKAQRKANTKGNKMTVSKPVELFTSEGYRVLVGKNNKQNDKLTLKDANRNDFWFHTKNIHGSHVILETNGVEPSEKAIFEAAVIAAKHSKAKNSQSVPVDYTKVRYVSKPQGSKPGMVIYVKQKTLYVDPSHEE